MPVNWPIGVLWALVGFAALLVFGPIVIQLLGPTRLLVVGCVLVAYASGRKDGRNGLQ